MEIRRSLPKDVGEIALAEEKIFSDPWRESDITSLISNHLEYIIA